MNNYDVSVKILIIKSHNSNHAEILYEEIHKEELWAQDINEALDKFDPYGYLKNISEQTIKKLKRSRKDVVKTEEGHRVEGLITIQNKWKKTNCIEKRHTFFIT